MSKGKAPVLLIGLFLAITAIALAGSSSSLSSTQPDDQTCARLTGCQKAASGCASNAAQSDKRECPMGAAAKTGQCEKSCAGKAGKTAAVERIREAEGKVYTLTGRYICCHCDLGMGEGCQPAFKTTGGKCYLLSTNNLTKKLRAEARDKNVEIVSRVKKYDGVKYLEVEAVRASS